MGTHKENETTADGGENCSMVVELPLGEAAATFSLEKAVCSHGLFMMAPNYWDPKSKTLQRPLRLSHDFDHPDHETSVTVRISQPCHSLDSLQLQVFGTDSLSSQHQLSLLNQVRRMLRLSEEDNQSVREFQEIHGEAKEKGFGRVFRSPTLFEDMVKCILLCNCQWSRTLTMARALCELQCELQQPSSSAPHAKVDNDMQIVNQVTQTEKFSPKTPAGQESKRKHGVQKRPVKLASRFTEVNAVLEEVPDLKKSCHDVIDSFHGAGALCPGLHQLDKIEDFVRPCDPCHTSTEIAQIRLCASSNLQSSEGTEAYSLEKIGNFPSPKELASLDETLLAKRCNLGYRASRILNLAQHVVERRIQLRELEEACRRPSLSCYDKLVERLQEIDGFGPFTCANVLMCMGFYHVVPTDSETIRHLKQVHAKNSSIRTVKEDVEVIYGKYAPFQFLAYWNEVWQFYEEWFGNISEMDPANYKLITAANMKPKRNGRNKRIRTSLTENLLH